MKVFSAGFLIVATVFGASGASAQSVPKAETAHRTGMSLTLAQALGRVDKLDPTVRSKMVERMRAALAERRAQWQRVQAHVGTRVGYMLGAANVADTDGGPTFRYDRAGIGAVASLRVPLYDGGAIDADISLARQQQKASRYEVVLSRQQARQQVLVAYAALVAAQEKVDAMNREIKRAQELLKLAEARSETGVGQQADVARAQLNLTGRREQLLSVRQLEASAMAALRAALLIPAGAQVSPAGSLDDVATWRRPGARGLPELQLADSEVRVAQRKRDRAKAGYLPRVDLLANGTYGNFSGLPWSGEGGLAAGAVPPDDRLVGNLTGAAAAGVVLSWSAFDSFSTRDAVKDAEYQVSASQQRRRAVAQKIEQAHQDALARERFAKLRQDALAKGVEQASRAVQLAKARYETGSGLLTEVLDAELEAISVEMRKIQADYDAAVAHVDRMRSEGVKL